MVATYRKTQRLIGTLSKQTIKSIRLYYRELSNPFILFEIVNPKNQSCFIYTDYLFSPFGLSYTYDYDKIDLDAMPEIKKLPKEMMESIERQVARENKEDFKLRGKLLSQIEYCTLSFKGLYGYDMAWGMNSMYDGPAFPLWDEGIAVGCLCTIEKRTISVQNAEESDMMYQLTIGHMSTEHLQKLATIVAQALLNPPAPYKGEITTVEQVKETGMGLKIVGKMPLDLLARQTR